MSSWRPVRRVLDNGLVVLVQEHAAVESVVLRVAVAAGAVFERPEEAGLASLVAQSLTRGTDRRTKEQIGEVLDFRGALLAGSGGRHTAVLAGRGRVVDLEELLELAADCVMNARFPDEEVAKVRGERLTLLREQEDDPGVVATRNLREQLYPPGHLYSWPAAGKRETVEALAAPQLRDFHARHYGPDRACLVLVGGVATERASELVAERFGAWRPRGAPGFRGAQPTVPEVEASPGPERRTAALPAKSQVQIALGRVTLRRRDPRYYAALLANTVLGEFAMGGRLGRQVREERGLAYTVGSGLAAALGPGPWVVHAGVQPVHVEEAMACVRQVLREAGARPPSGQELEDARASLVRSLPRALESPAGVAGLLQQIELYDLGLDYPERFGRAIEAVTEEEVAQVVRSLYRPEGLYESLAGPLQESG